MYEQHEMPEHAGGQPVSRDGTPVFDSAGERVGTLSAVDALSGMLSVHRGHIFGHDYLVPREAVARADSFGIYLNARKDTLQSTDSSSTAMTHTDMAVGPRQSAPAALAATVAGLPGVVQQTAGQVAQQVDNDTLTAARTEAEGAKGMLHDKAAESMATASDGLSGAATAVGQVSEGLRRIDHGVLSQYTDRAAQQLEELATRLRDMTPEQALHEIEQLARRQPVLFLAGAFAVGLLGARVLHGASGHDEKNDER